MHLSLNMGNILTKAYNFLKAYVFSFRSAKNAAARSRLDHPERLPPDAFTTPTEVVSPTKKCSPFYLACRNNEVGNVKELLETITQEQLDQVEPNGSTALHAASYQGHVEVVRLLLRGGADRSIQNRYKYLPFDEAANDEIRQLFFRTPNNNRLVSDTGAIEWELINDNSDDVLGKAMEERQIIYSIYYNSNGRISIQRMFDKIEKNYIGEGLSMIENIESIKHFFQKATKEQNPIWIIKAYTAETDFYNVLNAEIALGASKYQSERRYIVALLRYHPKLDDISFTGTSYRVMQVNNTDLKRYQVDRWSMTKSFLSSSQDEKIAAYFLCRQEMAREGRATSDRYAVDGSSIKSWVMCKYQIKHARTALHIAETSQYACEGEILIMPYTVFQVKSIEKINASYLPDGQTITEIQLVECEHDFNDER